MRSYVIWTLIFVLSLVSMTTGVGAYYLAWAIGLVAATIAVLLIIAIPIFVLFLHLALKERAIPRPDHEITPEEMERLLAGQNRKMALLQGQKEALDLLIDSHRRVN